MKKFQILLLAVSVLFLTSCTTNITKPKEVPQPTEVRFSKFKNIEMKEVGISERFKNHSANKKAQKKIDETLVRDMSYIFPNLKKIKSDENFSKNKQTLQITPIIKEVKFISGAARFWIGAWAGSSAILMQVDFVDSSTGKVIANPEFYKVANAWQGAWTMGYADNKMLDDIAKSIVNYSSSNK